VTALSQIVQHYRQEGFSLIPLLGGDDPSRGKSPASSWLAYQRQQPTINALQQWFEVAQYSAFGVVCGRVSQLVVLDVDDLAVADTFQQRFPQLFDTHRVRSGLRGGPHLYFRVDFPVKTQKILGGDLKAEGSYVVGAGSQIAGATWQLEQDRPPRWLNRAELDAMLAFLSPAPTFTPYTPVPRPMCLSASLPAPPALIPLPVNMPVPDSTAPIEQNETVALVEPDETAPNPFASVSASPHMRETVRRLYRERVQQSQRRNQTLFELACQLRDAHYHQAWVIDALADTHAQEPARQPHKLHRESVARRRREALNTIASAFSRPRRLGKSIFVERDEPASRLPGTVREHLLQHPDGAAILRVLEGLYFAHLSADTAFSEAEAQGWLHGQVGRHSLRKALEAHTEAGIAIFEAVPPPSVRFCPPNKNAFSWLTTGALSASALALGEPRGDNPEKNPPEAHPHHRQAKRYYLPSHADLCQKLGVELLPGDPIYADDLTSPKRYRMALEREFLKRRPGAYYQALLAGRLGSSTRSIRRYHQAIGVHSRASYEETWVGWATLASLPPKADLAELRLGGRVLMDETGKKYPAFRELAAKLLKQGRKLAHRHQRANVYWIGEVEPAMLHTQMVSKNYMRQPASDFGKEVLAAASLPTLPDNTPEAPGPDGRVEADLVYVKRLPTYAPTLAEKRPRQRHDRRKYRFPLDDPYQERWARQLYEAMPDLSRCHARQIVDLYSAELVEAGLKLMRWRLARGWQLGELEKPIGYLLTVLRVRWRGKYGFHVPYPRFEGQRKRKPRVRKSASGPTNNPPALQMELCYTIES